MKVCIAEKPSVAQSIAQILGANQRRDGYFEGNDYQVTWTFGHLCELKTPEEYDDKWKSWSLVWLPIIPQRFGITLKDDSGIKKQFEIIRHLYENAECIINCGDAGQEGELIQRWVMQKAGAVERERMGQLPIYRLWINSMTDEAIREGFQHLELQQKYERLYMAGLSRAIGDWLLGMNATRLYTIRYGQTGQRQVLSIGRVQTPTLAMIVKRHFEIVNFEPQQYWELKTQYRDVTFNSTKGRYDKIDEANEALAAIQNSLFTIKDVQKKAGKEVPKRLYDLTSLQVDCNRKFGFSAEDTLRFIQSLYEKKVTTYPRVDTTFLPDDVYPKCPNILRGLRGYEALTAPLLAPGKKLPKSKLFFDNTKVTDHHAIIPTGVPAMNLTGPERQVYDLVSRRFIASFYPECQFSTTTVLGEASKPVSEGEDKPSGVEFKATGKVITNPGWRVVYGDQKADEDDEKEGGILPDFVVGESGPHIPSLLEKWTQPPKLYTEASLLRAMETAGKQCEDEELRDAMKENGIGRPSTRAAIIETLYKRRYIRKEKKNLVATQTGIDVIQVIHEEILKSPELTGQWERKLRMIEKGEYDASTFIAELKQMVVEIIKSVMSDNSNRQVAYVDIEVEKKKAAAEKKAARKTEGNETKKTEGSATKPKKPRKKKEIIPTVCPLCGAPVIKGHTAYGCSNWKNGCTWRLPFDANRQSEV